jgi:hypothetical protein
VVEGRGKERWCRTNKDLRINLKNRHRVIFKVKILKDLLWGVYMYPRSSGQYGTVDMVLIEDPPPMIGKNGLRAVGRKGIW